MRIKKITKLKSGKYKMEFDNNTKIITYDNILIKNNILFKKEIDDELYNKLYNETLDYNLYSRVLKYTLIKMRSLKEIKKYMKLSLGKNEREWLKLLNKKRKGILDEVHLKEKQLSRIDYLRYEMDWENKE